MTNDGSLPGSVREKFLTAEEVSQRYRGLITVGTLVPQIRSLVLYPAEAWRGGGDADLRVRGRRIVRAPARFRT